jgi:hypothetical protein
VTRLVRLDPVGGIAGDMFAAAVLDAVPALEAAARAALAALPLPPGLEWQAAPVTLGGFSGRQVSVTLSGLPEAEAGRDHRHSHRHFSDIAAMLDAAALPGDTARHALGIYRHLAEAEAEVHGTSVEKVAFHEVGAWDSIVDITVAAALIDALGPAEWHCGALPLGGGMVETAHGRVPVPAPATALLLQGAALRDDGIGGERVTPTGAAILRHLAVRFAPLPPGRLEGTGTGFGHRRLPGTMNALRLLLCAPAPAAGDVVERIGFDLDDQTPEEIATALDHLRALPGLRDAVSWPVQGKKGRHAIRVELLADPGAADAIARACFEQTTTLGLRRETLRRDTLERRAGEAVTEAGAIRTKAARRPGGVTVKAEADDIAQSGGSLRDRRRLAARIEAEDTP